MMMDIACDNTLRYEDVEGLADIAIKKNVTITFTANADGGYEVAISPNMWTTTTDTNPQVIFDASKE